MSYRVVFERSVFRDMDVLAPLDCQRIRDMVLGLFQDPRPYGSRKMRGLSDVYRIRAGRYRVIYQILEKDKTICMFRVGHRKDVYRNL